MKKALIASAALAGLFPFAASAQERTLTISVYAFAQDDFKRQVYDPFEAKCGCKLVVETGNSVERLAKMEANKANPVVDMAVVSMADALAASRAGLIDKIDTSRLENFSKLYDVATFDEGVEAVRGVCEIAAVTRGAQGSVIATADGLVHVEAHAVPKVVDSTGAGDLYAAGFLYGWTQGKPLDECGRLGSIAAAAVIGHMGPRPGLSLAQLVAEG